MKILEQKRETAKRLRHQFDSGGPFELDNELDDILAERDDKLDTLADTGSERNTEHLTCPTEMTEKDGSACHYANTPTVSSDAKSNETVIRKSAEFTMKSSCVTEQQRGDTKGPYQEHERVSAVLKLQCLARGFRSRLRFRNTCEQRRQVTLPQS